MLAFDLGQRGRVPLALVEPYSHGQREQDAGSARPREPGALLPPRGHRSLDTDCQRHQVLQVNQNLKK